MRIAKKMGTDNPFDVHLDCLGLNHLPLGPDIDQALDVLQDMLTTHQVYLPNFFERMPSDDRSRN